MPPRALITDLVRHHAKRVAREVGYGWPDSIALPDFIIMPPIAFVISPRI